MLTGVRSKLEETGEWFASHPLRREMYALAMGIAVGVGMTLAAVQTGESLSAAFSSGLVGAVSGSVAVYVLVLLDVAGGLN